MVEEVGGEASIAQVGRGAGDWRDARGAWLCCPGASINLQRLTNTMSDTSTPVETTPAPVEPQTTAKPVVPLPDKAVVERPALDPTRYGDWEKNGRCIDF